MADQPVFISYARKTSRTYVIPAPDAKPTQAPGAMGFAIHVVGEKTIMRRYAPVRSISEDSPSSLARCRERVRVRDICQARLSEAPDILNSSQLGPAKVRGQSA